MKKYLNHNLGLVRGGGLGVFYEGRHFFQDYFSSVDKQAAIYLLGAVSFTCDVNQQVREHTQDVNQWWGNRL
jgi:hypothetical protein